MKLARRLGLALILGVWVVFAVFAAIRIQRESALFDEDMRRDHRILATTLAPVISAHWRDDGEAAALTLVHRINDARAGITIRWVSLAPSAAPDVRPVVATDLRTMLGTSSLVQLVEDRADAAGGEALLVTYVRLATPPSDAALELAESTAPKAAYLRATAYNSLLTVLVVAVVCGLLAMALGAHYVGRPASRLIARAREIGAGGADRPPLTLRQQDELGELAAALERMATDLSLAHQREAREIEAQLATLEQLRHADRLTHAGQMAAALAHELGTPLNVMRGHAQRVLRGGKSAEQIRDSVAAIAAQTERMTELVRKLLDYTRRRPPQRAPASLTDLVSATADLLTPIAAGRRVRLITEIEPVAPVSVDVGQVQQVLINLVLNAVHATSEGGTVTIRFVTDPAVSMPGASLETRRCAVVHVEDTGAGIPADVLPRVFDPFFTTKPSGEGTGLGLSIARDIVAEHGGFIAVRSELGKGSIFSVYFPVEAPWAGQSSSSTTTPVPATSSSSS